MTRVTQGRRLSDGFHYFDSEPGDYWRQFYGEADELDGYAFPSEERGRRWNWTIRDPAGLLGTIGKHDITENADGTITVSPSILDSSPSTGEGWHGFLEAGVWREA